MNLLFSIVIPTFNRKKELTRCLNSLVNQTYKNFEVIVCDDGSSDGSDAVVADYYNLMDIKYIWNENWGGPARPRNIGLAEATGEWVCFLDSDDWYHDDRLRILSDIINSEFDLYYHRLIAIDSDARKSSLDTRQIDNKNPGLNLLTGFNGILTSSTCIRRESLEALNANFSENKDIVGLEDFDLWIRLGLSGFRYKFINKSLGFYSKGGNDHISYTDQRQIDRLSVLYNTYQDRLNNEEKKLSLAAFNYQKGCLLIEGNKKKEGLKCFISALKEGAVTVKLRSLWRISKLYI